MDKRDYSRFYQSINYYRYKNTPIKLSQYLSCSDTELSRLNINLEKLDKRVDLYANSLMPNHFHFEIKQLTDHGISNFIADISNSYAKYFNTKNDRVGVLFQGPFKAKLIETDEQFIHIARYIHINPGVSSIVKKEDLENYPWSSFGEYLGVNRRLNLCEKDMLMKYLKSIDEFKKFTLDQVDYNKSIKSIEHLITDDFTRRVE